MKNKIIPSIPKNVHSDNFQSEFRIQQSGENKLKPTKMSKSIIVGMISMWVSLMSLLIPIIWVVVMCNAGDDKILTESSDLDINDVPLKRYGLSPDYSRASDKFGYQVDSGKITEYRKLRNIGISFRKTGQT